MTNLERPVSEGNGDYQSSTPEQGKTFSALPEGILPFQGRGDAPSYEAYAMYVWTQIQKGEPFEPYGGRGDRGAIDGYVGYFVTEMRKRTQNQGQ